MPVIPNWPDSPARSNGGLTVVQLRVLMVLADGNPLLTRAKVCERIGLSPISGTFVRAVNGLREGSSSGKAQKGLLDLGLVEKVDLDIDGLVETSYRVTEKGRQALRDTVRSGTALPPLRSRESSTNTRYKVGE